LKKIISKIIFVSVHDYKAELFDTDKRLTEEQLISVNRVFGIIDTMSDIIDNIEDRLEKVSRYITLINRINKLIITMDESLGDKSEYYFSKILAFDILNDIKMRRGDIIGTLKVANRFILAGDIDYTNDTLSMIGQIVDEGGNDMFYTMDRFMEFTENYNDQQKITYDCSVEDMYNIYRMTTTEEEIKNDLVEYLSTRL
jgi:hypothetical protein